MIKRKRKRKESTLNADERLKKERKLNAIFGAPGGGGRGVLGLKQCNSSQPTFSVGLSLTLMHSYRALKVEGQEQQRFQVRIIFMDLIFDTLYTDGN